VKVPAVVELQDTVAVAGNGGTTLAGVIAPQVRPVGTVSVRATVPAKPFSAVTVIVDVAEEPAFTAAGDVAAIVMSTWLNVAVAVWTRVPLVPVMVRVKVAAVVELHDTVSVAGKGGITLSGVIAPQVRPAGTVSVRETVPANPFRALTVIVEVAEEPAFTAAGDVAAIVKSTKVKVAVAVWTRVPIVPVIVTLNVAAVVALQDSVAVPVPVMLASVMAPQVRPAGTVSVRATTPAKPLRPVTVMVEVAEEPALTAAGEVAVMVKSTKLNVAVAV
jgi:hypothetical protein